MTYTVRTTESFEKQFKKKHRDKKDYLESVIEKLEQFPDRYGKPLRGRLHGTWQIKLGGNSGSGTRSTRKRKKSY